MENWKKVSNYANILYRILIFLTLLDQIQSMKYDYVTFTSTIKLLNLNSNARLHSHDVKYGSGSGQQSVTAVRTADDHNSYWQIITKHKETNSIERGQPVKCGDVVRLNHLSTKRNLHSHLFQSPLSNNQEVSAFGENGEGDTGDNWIVECDDEFWKRDEPIRLKHLDTNKYLHITGDTFGRPIHGQLEVSCYHNANQYNLWRVNEGVYIKPNEEYNSNDNSHSEL